MKASGGTIVSNINPKWNNNSGSIISYKKVIVTNINPK